MSDALSRLTAALSDRYTFERDAHGGASLLGQGGMATVYLATDLKHHRKVAVKVLRAEIAATLGAERFSREIEVTAQLQHPHILPLLDSGEVAGFFYYACHVVRAWRVAPRPAPAREAAQPRGRDHDRSGRPELLVFEKRAWSDDSPGPP